MPTFSGGTARVVDRIPHPEGSPPYIEYVIRVRPTGAPADGSQDFEVRAQANGTAADLKAKGKAAIATYLASLNLTAADNIPTSASLSVAADGTLS